jgi:hypothetical protein
VSEWIARTTLWAHILAGVVALATFWIPWLVTKGSTLHRRAGWVYTSAMLGVSVSAWALAALRYFDSKPANDRAAQFLAFAGLLAASSVSFGLRALRPRRAPHGRAWDFGLPTLLLLASSALALQGIRHGSTLWLVFAAIGGLSALSQLRSARAPARTRRERILEHMGGMGATCIATVTAVLVVNARNLGLEPFGVWLWVLPTLLGTVGIQLWARRWREPRSQVAPAAARRSGGAGALDESS